MKPRIQNEREAGNYGFRAMGTFAAKFRNRIIAFDILEQVLFE